MALWQRLRTSSREDGYLGRTEPVVQPAAKDRWVHSGRFLSWGKGEREGEGGYGTRLAREENKQRRGPDACFAPAKAYTRRLAHPKLSLPKSDRGWVGVGKGGHL